MLLLYLFLVFTVIPFVELALLIYLGAEVLGFWPTLGLVIFTALLGTILVRWQGMKALTRIHRRIGRGQVPADELFDGVLILVAGLLLITPGVLTDIAGLALLFPPIRYLLKRQLRRWAKRQVEIRTARVSDQFWAHVQSRESPYRGDDVIDGEVVEAEVIETRVIE
jgi:UPF0716 protein FxsA